MYYVVAATFNGPFTFRLTGLTTGRSRNHLGNTTDDGWTRVVGQQDRPPGRGMRCELKFTIE